ncbi:MAG: shikimate 5-dehydrogenase-like protein [Bryobacterales bacterium]|nr:shikimate 5-dehydrogenase-like protein [Bryobacterales bacterium]
MDINKDTQLCMSLSGRPGNFGTRFHNFLYRELGLNFIYKAFSTSDLHGAIAGIRALSIRGCAVSMPFKEGCIEYLDELDLSADGIRSVNTIVNTGGFLKGYNTDYIAVLSLLRSHEVPTDVEFALRGSGGMAKAVASALRDAGFKKGAIVARNQAAGEALAAQYRYNWMPELESRTPALLINVTPIGMAGAPEAAQLSFHQETIRAAEVVFDVVAQPAQTPLIQLAQALGKKTISGAEVIALQAVEQFVLYTGKRPEAALMEKAAAFARRSS